MRVNVQSCTLGRMYRARNTVGRLFRGAQSPTNYQYEYSAMRAQSNDNTAQGVSLIQVGGGESLLTQIPIDPPTDVGLPPQSTADGEPLERNKEGASPGVTREKKGSGQRPRGRNRRFRKARPEGCKPKGPDGFGVPRTRIVIRTRRLKRYTSSSRKGPPTFSIDTSYQVFVDCYPCQLSLKNWSQ